MRLNTHQSPIRVSLDLPTRSRDRVVSSPPRSSLPAFRRWHCRSAVRNIHGGTIEYFFAPINWTRSGNKLLRPEPLGSAPPQRPSRRDTDAITHPNSPSTFNLAESIPSPGVRLHPPPGPHLWSPGFQFPFLFSTIHPAPDTYH